MEFDPLGLSVKDLKTQALIARYDSTGDLYPFHEAMTTNSASAFLTSVNLWHRRLGHPNSQTVSSLLQHFQIPCRKDSHDPALCEACQRGKHVRLPFHLSKTSTVTSKGPKILAYFIEGIKTYGL